MIAIILDLERIKNALIVVLKVGLFRQASLLISNKSLDMVMSLMQKVWRIIYRPTYNYNFIDF